jgi:hypothetical protein
MKTLISFYKLTRPGGIGWQKVIETAEAEGTPIENSQEDSRSIAKELLCVFLGAITIYSALFATGSWIYGNTLPAMALSLLALIGGYFIFKVWGKLKTG